MERINRPEMTYYREIYKSPRWQGQPYQTLMIYCEQGLGDVIQMARYFPNDAILHCPKTLHRLFPNKCLDKDDPNLPPHDYHTLSMELPFLTTPKPVPYIHVNPIELDDSFKIGIAWEGSPTHPNNIQRSLKLSNFQHLQSPKTKLFMLQDQIHLPELVDVDLELHTTERKDMYDTACLIQAMDVVVTVDTSILHLAGALNKKTYGILRDNYDPRWDVKNWYPNVTLLKNTIIKIKGIT